MSTKIDSRVVSKAIRQEVRPVLKSIGFSEFTSRTAWRARDHSIEIDFQSFSDYLADAVGCTTFSFSVNLGVYYPCVEVVPWGWPARQDKWPKEVMCQARLNATKSLVQMKLPREDIWYVNPDGSNLPEAIADSRKVILEQGVGWLEKFSDLTRAMEAFPRPQEEDAVTDLGGSLGSLQRARNVASLAVHLGDRDLARTAFEVVLTNPYYERLDDIKGEVRGYLQWLASSTD